jgi:hypothetical protein
MKVHVPEDVKPDSIKYENTGFWGFLGICVLLAILFFGLGILTCPVTTYPTVQEKEAALSACNQMHGQIEFVKEGYLNDNPVRDINCLTSNSYVSLYKATDHYVWQK